MESKKNEIRKGPWKAEEDEVLIDHVKKHGPREWSSIRSKGLLKRTGKSCRLRWVNKLRPNLKNGCKFTAEEERVVIELQSQFGNKWAKIATFLRGRTDNDVKNFWSSRQKRLARILQASASSSSSNLNPKPHKAKKEVSSVRHEPPSYAMEGESSARAHLSAQPLSTVQLPLPTNLIKQEEPDSDGTNALQVEVAFSHPFPFNLFGPPETGLLSPFFNPASTQTPDIFFDDFPTDMFDNMEPLPSP